MSQVQLADVQASQKNLEELILNKMTEMEAQIQTAGLGKANTVAKLADEFRIFRELIFGMLSLLRTQIQECSRVVDGLEMRSRRKALIFTGAPEAEKEDCKSVILGILHEKMVMNNITGDSIKLCHRLGAINKDRPRPILVRLASVEDKSSVWKKKATLKGSSITIKEFLTRSRQMVFSKARLHFGMRSCWTQDGTIVIKSSDGSRHKISSQAELDPLLAKYTKQADGRNKPGNKH